MIEVMRRSQKMSSFSLNAVCAEFLGKQKEDVHHTQIRQFYVTPPDDPNFKNLRNRLAVYCLKDAELPLELMQKLLVVVNNIEMARVTGVPMDYLFSRG